VQIETIWITRSPQLPKDVRCCGEFSGFFQSGIGSDTFVYFT